jgi:hypothetical protein
MRSSDSKPKPPANVGFTTPPSVLPESRQISWIFDHQILAETKFPQSRVRQKRDFLNLFKLIWVAQSSHAKIFLFQFFRNQ